MKAYLKSLRQLGWYFADMSLTCANTPSLRRRALFAKEVYHEIRTLCCRIENFIAREKSISDFSERYSEIFELVQKFNKREKSWLK